MVSVELSKHMIKLDNNIRLNNLDRVTFLVYRVLAILVLCKAHG